MKEREEEKIGETEEKYTFGEMGTIPLPRGCHEYIRWSDWTRTTKDNLHIFFVSMIFIFSSRFQRFNVDGFYQEEDEEDGPILYRDDDNMEDEGEDADLTPMLIIMLTVALIFY